MEGSSGAQINFELQDIYSEKQLDVSLGLTVGVAGKAKVSAGFDFSKKEKVSRILVRLQQIYYTVTFDAKGRPSDYFQPSVTPAMVSRTLDGIPTSPVYVSNVKYGRVAYYSFESTATQDSLRVRVDAAFKMLGGKVSTQIEAAVSKISNKNETKISGTIIGGNGADAIKSINSFPDFLKFVTEGGDFTKASPGKPIAYTLRRLSDNGVFNIVKTSEYTVRSCKEVFQTGDIVLSKVYGRNGNTELYGKIKVQIGYDGETELTTPNNDLIFNRTSDSYLAITQGKDTENNENTTGPKIKIMSDKYDKAFLFITTDLYDNDGDKPYNLDEKFENNNTLKVYFRDLDPNQANEVIMKEVGYTTESYKLAGAKKCLQYLLGNLNNPCIKYADEPDYSTGYAPSTDLIDLKFTINTK
jgi:thiol-activated cytolysin